MDLETAEEPETNCQHLLDHRKSKRIQNDIYFCFIDCAKAFDCKDHYKLWKNSSRDGNTRPPYLPPEKPVYRSIATYNWGQNIGVVLNWERSMLRLYIVYLTSMQSTSWEMLGWMKHKLESRLLGEISTTSDKQMITTLMVESEEELKNLLMKVKEESEKAGLKLNIQITLRSWHPILSLHGK